MESMMSFNEKDFTDLELLGAFFLFSLDPDNEFEFSNYYPEFKVLVENAHAEIRSIRSLEDTQYHFWQRVRCPTVFIREEGYVGE